MITKTASTALVILTAVAVAPAAPARAATTVIKTTSCPRRTEGQIDAFLKTFVEPLNAMKADVRIDYLGGPEVTPVKEQGEALKRGLIDMIVCPAPYYGGMFPEARIPGTQNVSIREMRNDGAWNMIEKIWEKNLNGHILAWIYPHITFYTYFVDKPKLSRKTGLDLRDMKIRSSGLYNPFLKAMGATTVAMPPSEIYTALQRGVIDGLATTWGSIARRGWQHLIKYRVRPSFFGPSVMAVINLAKWDSLSKEQQNLLNRQAKILETKGDAIIVKLGDEDDRKLRQAGVKDIVLKGAYRKAYLKTIYAAKWAQTDRINKDTPGYEKLKSLVYHMPGK